MALAVLAVAPLRAQQQSPAPPEVPVVENTVSSNAAVQHHAISDTDLLEMLRNHFDERTLISVIELNDTRFDVSPEALIALKKAGLTDRVIAAMLEAKRRPPPQASAGPDQPSGAAASATLSGVAEPTPGDPQSLQAIMVRAQASMSRLQAMGYGAVMPSLNGMGMFGAPTSAALPRVQLLAMPENVDLSPSYAQRAISRLSGGGGAARATSMFRSLAMEALRFASVAGGPSGVAAGMAARSGISMFGRLVPGSRPSTPAITYAWGLPGPHANRVLPLGALSFAVHYGDIPGMDPDSLEPTVLRLAVTRDNYRLLGATRQKMGPEMTGANGEWIAEERITVHAIRAGRGIYTVKLDSPLPTGEYALVLRPVKGYKSQPSAFDSSGQLTGTAWDFSCP